MIFESTQIKGKGRGRPMGFPTINLKIPDIFELKDGVYAVNVIIKNIKYLGAMHFGSTPTFEEKEKSLEIYLIGLDDQAVNKLENLEGKIIKVKVLKFLRNIVKFRLVEDLKKQIGEDVRQINILQFRIQSSELKSMS
jgi:riboflavin kinase / FMN adenylyltransferase